MAAKDKKDQKLEAVKVAMQQIEKQYGKGAIMKLGGSRAAEKIPIKAFVKWDDLSLPILEGQKVGDLSILTEKKEVVASSTLYAKKRVEKTFFCRVRDFFKDLF